MVYVMMPHRYQAVTRRSQLSPPMIDVPMSAEVTDRSISKVSSEKSRLSTTGSNACDAIRQVHPPMSGVLTTIATSSRSTRRTAISYFRSVSPSLIFRLGIFVVQNQMSVACHWRSLWVNGHSGRTSNYLTSYRLSA